MQYGFPSDSFIQKEEKKEEKPKSPKVGRRLSARVGDFFKARTKSEVPVPAKVEENPPKIEEPTPVAPLENPAAEEAAATPAATEEAKAEEPKPEEPKVEAPPAAPVVAATA